MADKVDCTSCGRFLPGRNRVSVLERNLYLLMLGLDNSGKTCTAKTLVGESLDNVAPTIGFSKVSSKYKGFNVTIYDLGGSKSFRGIWPKYYHEVHGFIFVVDASDNSRMEETAEVFQTILQDDKVKGKPILMLCNKADLDESKDEVHVVNTLQVERLVNIARCPTRVEPSVATKNQGIKEGFKWIVKTVIANISELGPRIDKDVEEEQRIEAERREEVRKRIEERKLQEGDADGTGSQADNLDEEEPPGFVPIDEAVAAKLEEETKNAIDVPPDTPIDDDNDEGGKDDDEEQKQDDNNLIDENKIAIIDDMKPPSSEDQEAAPKPLTAPETLPPLKNGGGSRRNSNSSNNIIKSNSSSRRNSQTNGVETFIKTGKMDLEPTNGTNGLKKAPFGRKLSNSSVKTNASSKAGSGAGSRRSSKVGV